MFSQGTWIEQQSAGSSEMSFLAERAGALLCIAGPSFHLARSPLYHSPPLVIPVLPQELIVRILKHLVQVDDNQRVKNLKACSLVCSKWLPLARWHLFHTTVVVDGHRVRNFGAFMEVIRHSPGVCYCIQVLSLQADRVLSGPGTPISAAIIQEFLGRLPRLSTLEISGLRFEAFPLPIPRVVGPFTLSRLRIMNQRSWTSNGGDLLDVLGLFTELGELTLENLGELKDSVCTDGGYGSRFTEDMLSSLHTSSPCAIKELNLYSVSQLHFYLEVFKRTRSVETIRSLAVRCGHPVQIPGFARDLGSFFAEAGMGITQLSIELSGCFHNRLHAHVADDCNKIFNLLLPGLPHLSSLRTFGLLILFPHDPAIPGLMWSLLVAILSALPPNVRRIQLCLQLDMYSRRPDHMAPFPWDSPWLAPQLHWGDLRRVLSRFGRLEVIRFTKSSSDKSKQTISEPDELEKARISQYLPELRNRKALLFDNC